MSEEDTSGISWNEHDLHVAILQMLHIASGTHHEMGFSKKNLMDSLGVHSGLEIEVALGDLSKMDFVRSDDRSFFITEKGSDYLKENLTTGE